MGKLGIARTANRPRPNNNRQSTQNRESNSQLAFNLSAKVIILLHLHAFGFHVFTFRHAFSCFPALFCPRFPSPFPSLGGLRTTFRLETADIVRCSTLYPSTDWTSILFLPQYLFFLIEVLLALQKAETLKIKRADYYTQSHLFKIKPDNFCTKLHGFSQKQVGFQKHPHSLSSTSLLFK